eukprot:gene8494-biopygen15168
MIPWGRSRCHGDDCWLCKRRRVPKFCRLHATLPLRVTNPPPPAGFPPRNTTFGRVAVCGDGEGLQKHELFGHIRWLRNRGPAAPPARALMTSAPRRSVNDADRARPPGAAPDGGKAPRRGWEPPARRIFQHVRGEIPTCCPEAGVYTAKACV